MFLKISCKNKKMGAIPSVSLPPVITCHNCAGCAKKCYARRMACRRPSVGAAWASNLELWKSNPALFEMELTQYCKISRFFRYFVGGDIPDPAFFEMMIRTAKNCPGCSFLAFTKNYNVVNDYLNDGGTIPENLKIIFSIWDKPINNPHKLPQSKVIFKGEQAPADAKICGGNCADCICRGVGCWMLPAGDTIYFAEH